MDKDNEFFRELHEVNNDFDSSNNDDVNIEEIIYQSENAVSDLTDTINQYNYMISEMSKIIDDEEFEQETIENIINDYRENIEFMKELKNDISESLDDLKSIIVKSGEAFAKSDFNSSDFEKNAYKYALMVGYLSSLITEYDDVMEDVSTNEEDFDELREFINNNQNINFDDEDDFDEDFYEDDFEEDDEEYSDENDEDSFYQDSNNKIINFDDYNDAFEGEDFENPYIKNYDEITQSIKDDIEKYESEINSVIKTLREENIEEEFIHKITKRYRRLIDRLKTQLENEYE